MFYVIDGKLTIELRDGVIELSKNEFIIIPRGVEHKPSAKEEVSVMLFEPKSTLNTGDNPGSLTNQHLERI